MKQKVNKKGNNNIETLKDIIRNNRMSTRPEFYSGRGATLSDLDEKILFGIHKDLNKKFGKKAGNAFIKMIDGINVLSATAFLNGLYELFHNNWKYNEQKPESISIPKDKDGNYNSTIGIVGIMESLFSSGRDDTKRIKHWFLKCNGIERTYYDENRCICYQ